MTNDDPGGAVEPPKRGRSQRNTRPPKNLEDYYLSTTGNCEIKAFHDNHTWELTKLPNNCQKIKDAGYTQLSKVSNKRRYTLKHNT